MKKLIFALFILIGISGICNAQADRVFQEDSIKTGRKANSFTINARHNYNTVSFSNLGSTDSIKVYHLNESGDTLDVSLRDLNTWSDLSGNLITGVSGNREYLVLHPNLYKVLIIYTNVATLSKTINVRRRGNNLK